MIITVFKHRKYSADECKNYHRTNTDLQPYHLEFVKILGYIKCGRWELLIRRLRDIYLSDYPQYKIDKQLLPVIMSGGTFAFQGQAGLLKPSNLVVLDLDQIPDMNTLKQVRETIESDRYTLACMLSPSGSGLKFFVEVDNDKDNSTHHEYFRAISDYYKENHPDVYRFLDKSGSDISRLCYVSSDPDLYYNEAHDIWTTKSQPEKSAAAVVSSAANPNQTIEGEEDCGGIWSDVDSSSETQKIIAFLEGSWIEKLPMTPHHRHDSSFFRAKELAEWGVPKEYADDYFSQFMTPDADASDIQRQIDNAYQKVSENGTFGSFYRGV